LGKRIGVVQFRKQAKRPAERQRRPPESSSQYRYDLKIKKSNKQALLPDVVTRSGLIREGTRLNQCVQPNAILCPKLRLVGVEN
jgi:hypothetical protein